MSDIVAIDFETYYKKKDYSIRDLGNWRYCHDDKFDPYLLSVWDGEQSWVGNPRDFNWTALNGQTVLAHNAGFERAVSSALVERGDIPAFTPKEWQCTANLASFAGNVRSLQDAVYVLEHRHLSKGVRDDMSGKTWAEAKSQGIAEKVAQYALGDVIECHNLWVKYSHLWPMRERQLSELTMKQCARGVRINTELLNRYISVLQEVIFHLERDLPWTERGKKPTSPIAIAEECRKVGIPAPPVKGEDEEGFSAWETTYGLKFAWVYGAGQWRQLNKLLKSLETIKDRLREDDTIDFSLLYFGGHTGRWSGGGSGLNFQNFRKIPLFIKSGKLVAPPANLSFADFEAWVAVNTDFILDIRRLIIPRAGKKMILSDLSQIEPRVLAWITGNWELLKQLESGMSIYEAFARGSMNWKGGKLKSESPDQYNRSKIQVLGCGYGCGWKKFITIAAEYLVYLDEMQSRTIVSDFRESNPKIVKLWAKLDRDFRNSLGGDFTMDLPSGRTMTYHKVSRSYKMKRNNETGTYGSQLVYTASIGRDDFEFYGGKLTENAVQAIARDIFGEQLLVLENQIGEVLFSVHDEAIMEADENATPKDVEHIMSQTPEWMPGLPVAAEAKEVPHYLK